MHLGPARFGLLRRRPHRLRAGHRQQRGVHDHLDLQRPGRPPADTCQTFLLAFLSTDGSDPTYTEPVRVCSPNPRVRTVLATGVPAGTQFRVLYQVDYIEPDTQRVRYTVWH
jgi:hypothetical protein